MATNQHAFGDDGFDAVVYNAPDDVTVGGAGFSMRRGRDVFPLDATARAVPLRFELRMKPPRVHAESYTFDDAELAVILLD